MLACGYGSTMVIVGAGKSGGVLSCGRNLSGQLGHGNTESSGELKAVKGPLLQTRVVAIDAGLAHSLALTEFGRVFAWGAGTWGQLGNSSHRMQQEPKEVRGPLSRHCIKAIACGDCHSMAVTEDGVLFAWGAGSCGQLGTGTQDDVSSPQVIGGLLSGRRIKQVSAGGDHSLALLEDGRVLAWGSNSNGQVGVGDVGVYQMMPAQVTGALVGPERIKAIAAGGMHSLALSGAGAIFSWGQGTNGQLGLASTSDAASPTQVCQSCAHPPWGLPIHPLSFLRKPPLRMPTPTHPVPKPQPPTPNPKRQSPNRRAGVWDPRKSAGGASGSRSPPLSGAHRSRRSVVLGLRDKRTVGVGLEGGQV
jgi:alpha-tubulin suppressor-like RCC1 family protein